MAELPRHIAVIMDGNGRWAEERGLSRTEGHRAGSETIERLLDHLLRLKIPYVSLYAFSTENWRRPKSEVRAIFGLLDEFVESRLQKLVKKGVRVVISGDISKLPAKTRGQVLNATRLTAKNRQLVANFCLNYGARAEIVRAAMLACTQSRGKITERQFRRFLWQPSLPDIDLLVRTAGEQRLSNFMLWQAAYAELYFTQKNWPELGPRDIDAAIAEFRRRRRKFGGL